MSDSPLEQYTLFLVGRTGNGKSSTGNSILEKHAFKQRKANVGLNDDVIESSSALVDGRSVQVIDGTGTGDTGSDAKLDTVSLIDCITKRLWGFVNKVNAIILVLKYGVRFTKQEKEAVELIKSLFGQDVLKKWGVIIMTHGDNFEMDNEDENGTFEDWFKEKTRDFQTLITECDNRCVLFNNKEKDEDKKRVQRNNLVKMVKAIKHEPYTKDDFDKEENERKRLIFKSKLPLLQGEIDALDRRANELMRDFDRRMDWQQEECKDVLRSMQQWLKNKREQLEDLDQGTGLVESLLTPIRVAELNVKSKMTQCEMSIMEERLEERIEKSEESKIIGVRDRTSFRTLWKEHKVVIFLLICVAVVILVGVPVGVSYG